MKKSLLFLVLFIILAILGVFYSILFSDETVTDQSTAVINGNVFEIEIANTSAKRIRGLSNRDFLPENGGMLFLFDQPEIKSFWMNEMRFPIDIIWIKEDRVVGFVESVSTPVAGEELFIYSSPEPVDKVLEINAGLVRKYGIEVRNIIELRI